MSALSAARLQRPERRHISTGEQSAVIKQLIKIGRFFKIREKIMEKQIIILVLANN